MLEWVRVETLEAERGELLRSAEQLKKIQRQQVENLVLQHENGVCVYVHKNMCVYVRVCFFRLVMAAMKRQGGNFCFYVRPFGMMVGDSVITEVKELRAKQQKFRAQAEMDHQALLDQVNGLDRENTKLRRQIDDLQEKVVSSESKVRKTVRDAESKEAQFSKQEATIHLLQQRVITLDATLQEQVLLFFSPVEFLRHQDV